MQYAAYDSPNVSHWGCMLCMHPDNPSYIYQISQMYPKKQELQGVAWFPHPCCSRLKWFRGLCSCSCCSYSCSPRLALAFASSPPTGCFISSTPGDMLRWCIVLHPSFASHLFLSCFLYQEEIYTCFGALHFIPFLCFAFFFHSLDRYPVSILFMWLLFLLLYIPYSLLATTQYVHMWQLH